MFRIPNYFEMNMTWDEAVRTIKGRGKGNLLEGMEEMNKIWDEHCIPQVIDLDGNTDSDFYEHWIYEVKIQHRV